MRPTENVLLFSMASLAYGQANFRLQRPALRALPLSLGVCRTQE
jgi:hypothetical protein